MTGRGSMGIGGKGVEGGFDGVTSGGGHAAAAVDGDHGHATGVARPGRRAVLRGLGAMAVGGASVSFLAACGGGGGGQPGDNPLAQPTDAVKKAVADAVTGGKIEVGKAQFLSDVGVIVTRPTADTYHAFSNVCTHAGGTIDRLSARGKLQCPLHGSEFDPTTGNVAEGPATQALPGRAVTAAGALA